MYIHDITAVSHLRTTAHPHPRPSPHHEAQLCFLVCRFLPVVLQLLYLVHLCVILPNPKLDCAANLTLPRVSQPSEEFEKTKTKKTFLPAALTVIMVSM